MAFMQIGSTNPKFSFILRKNPSSGMLIRDLRQGHILGYYSDHDKVFNCFFKDSDSDISYKKFKKDDFEYVNPSRYNAPEFVLDSITEFFEHIIKKEIEHDVAGYDNFLMINMVDIKRKYLDIFQRHFENVQISSSEICANNFRLTFSTKGTLKELLSFVQLFALFNTMKNRYLEDGEIVKYIERLTKVKAPYFVKYVFKISALRERRNFVKYKKSLEENSLGNETIEFKHGHLHDQRMDVVESLLSFKRSIIDFGCGDGNFAKRLYSRIEDAGKRYYAIDKDEEKLRIVKKRMEDSKNLIIGTSLSDISMCPDDMNSDFDVIMSEVIEHMSKEDAKSLIKEMISRQNVKSLIITTPNKDFNQFFMYDSDDEMRHESHQFEMGKVEFEKWIGEIVMTQKDRKVNFLEIGDRVNFISATVGVRIYSDCKNAKDVISNDILQIVENR